VLVLGVVVIGRAGALLIAFAAIVVLLIAVHILIVSAQKELKPKTEASSQAPNRQDVATETKESTVIVAERRRGVKALVIGADGRASTSKVQAVLWTFAIWFAFVFLLVWGRSLGCGEDDLSAEDRQACAAAAKDRTTFTDVAGGELQADYYVLLGFPLGVAIASKALTTSKVTAGTVTKPPVTEGVEGVPQGLRETISNDRGETDLVDFQYFAFNLLTLAFFWIEFLTKPDQGLPELPATLIGLAGLSAAAYTTRKALETDVKPGISTVIPRRIDLTEGFGVAVIGSGFEARTPVVPDDQAAPNATSVTPSARIMVNGISLKIEKWGATRIDAVITRALVERHEGASQAFAADLVVDMENATPSEPFSIELVPIAGAAG
jgi:hypothetical protein